MNPQSNNAPRWTPSVIEKTREFLETNSRGIRGVALHLGVSRQTVYNWQKEHPMFGELFRKPSCPS